MLSGIAIELGSCWLCLSLRNRHLVVQRCVDGLLPSRRYVRLGTLLWLHASNTYLEGTIASTSTLLYPDRTKSGLAATEHQSDPNISGCDCDGGFAVMAGTRKGGLIADWLCDVPLN
eukprot:2603680-Rhodomonas_salina.1